MVAAREVFSRLLFCGQKIAVERRKEEEKSGSPEILRKSGASSLVSQMGPVGDTSCKGPLALRSVSYQLSCHQLCLHEDPCQVPWLELFTEWPPKTEGGVNSRNSGKLPWSDQTPRACLFLQPCVSLILNGTSANRHGLADSSYCASIPLFHEESLLTFWLWELNGYSEILCGQLPIQ